MPTQNQNFDPFLLPTRTERLRQRPGSGNEPAELMAEREIVEPAIIKVQFSSVRLMSRLRDLGKKSGEVCVYKHRLLMAN